MSGLNKKIFISYAWESEEYKKKIWDLAGWITVNSILLEHPVTVITDHLFSTQPPLNGWYRWITSTIADADIVLVVCSHNYRSYFDGINDDRIRGGYGVTYEGTIIQRNIYAQRGINQKFYPILPDGGQISNIPDILSPYYNGLTFESENKRILDLLIGENPQHILPDEEVSNNVDHLSDNIIAFEEEISTEIIDKVENDTSPMNYDVQVLLRAYISLNDIEKVIIIKENVDDFEKFSTLDSFEKDKLFLKRIDDNEKLKALWASINNIKPFENNQNPFN